MEASLNSGMSTGLKNEEPKDTEFTYREAIFAWTLYQYRNRTPLTFEEFLSIYDGINKDIPTVKETIQGFSKLMTRGWLSKEQNRYALTSQGIRMIESITAEESDFWKKYKRLEEWCRLHPK